MLTGHFFKPVRREYDVHTSDAPCNNGDLMDLLDREVVATFARLTGLDTLAVPLRSDNGHADAEGPGPRHPACVALANSVYCKEPWALHLAQLARQPEPHWHECDLGMWCAVVPVACRGHCLAACKFACPTTMDKDRFMADAQLLDVLVQSFCDRAAPILNRLALESRKRQGSHGWPCPDDPPAHPSASHPKVICAIQYIEEHLSDSKLTVRRIAQSLDIHPDYLANLFTAEVGERTSHFINARRIERAKSLLSSTDWPIKQIAQRCGFAHANWFSHVFNLHTGVTPSQHRRDSRNSRSSD